MIDSHTHLDSCPPPNDELVRAAAEAGVPIVINTDAHWPANFDVARYGVATARRAWLTPDDVANTRSWAELRALQKQSRQ